MEPLHELFDPNQTPGNFIVGALIVIFAICITPFWGWCRWRWVTRRNEETWLHRFFNGQAGDLLWALIIAGAMLATLYLLVIKMSEGAFT